MMGTTDSTRRARETEEAATLASERYRARRAGLDAVGSKANVWFQDEGEQVADEAPLAALEDETICELLVRLMRMGPRNRRPLLGIAP